jgi:hypothetical protein
LKINPWRLFSESINVTIEDIHFILGPNTGSVSQPSEFKDANSPYDLNDVIPNLLRMFE